MGSLYEFWQIRPMKTGIIQMYIDNTLRYGVRETMLNVVVKKISGVLCFFLKIEAFTLDSA